MPSGDGFTSAERQRIDRAIRDAETLCRFEFSVYVGPTGAEPRAHAEHLHASLAAPARSVMVVVDPAARVLEIVTGADVRHRLEDPDVRLAALQMQADLSQGDLVGAVVRGVQMLAEHASTPPALRTS